MINIGKLAESISLCFIISRLLTDITIIAFAVIIVTELVCDKHYNTFKDVLLAFNAVLFPFA